MLWYSSCHCNNTEHIFLLFLVLTDVQAGVWKAFKSDYMVSWSPFRVNNKCMQAYQWASCRIWFFGLIQTIQLSIRLNQTVRNTHKINKSFASALPMKMKLCAQPIAFSLDGKSFSRGSFDWNRSGFECGGHRRQTPSKNSENSYFQAR